jgi:hypothetical protein
MPTTDDPWTTLQGVGIGQGGPVSPWEGLYTAPAAVALVNSIVAAAFGGFVGTFLTDGSAVVPGILGAVGFVASFLALRYLGERGFRRRIGAAAVHFPAVGS